MSRLLRRATTVQVTERSLCDVRHLAHHKSLSGYSSKRTLSILQRQNATAPASLSTRIPTQTRAITLNRDSDSHRTPGRPRWLNDADIIEGHLLEDGHVIWGVVIYRCTYGDDSAWATFMERLNASIRNSMRFHNALDLLAENSFKLTVMDNPQELDGADINAVRQHFLKWRKHAVREEQGSRSEIRARGGNPESDPNRLAFRYNYCVQVDEVSLQSIISTDPEDVFGEAWVHVIHANWNLEAIQRLKEEGRLDDIQMGLATELCDDSDDMHPPIDGCTEEDVGWMRVYYGTVIPRLVSLLRDSSDWDKVYWRPPDICYD